MLCTEITTSWHKHTDTCLLCHLPQLITLAITLPGIPERPLNLHNIILVQPPNLHNRPRRIPTRILPPKLNLHLITHRPIPEHISRVDHKAHAIGQFHSCHRCQVSHVLIGLADAWQAGWGERAVLLVDAAHSWGGFEWLVLVTLGMLLWVKRCTRDV